MTYTFTLITTKEDCDKLAAITNKEKADLEFLKLSLTRQMESTFNRSIATENELQSIDAQLAVFQSLLPSMPEGKLRRDTVLTIEALEHRKFRLEHPKSYVGKVGLLEKQYDISCIERRIEETVAFLNAIEARRNEI